MISVKEAFSTILEHIEVLPTEKCALNMAVGRVLRHDILADRDLPPYDRVMMDGIAAKSEAFTKKGPLTLKIVGNQSAGAVAKKISEKDTCLEIATGAVLPDGADIIVPVEEITTDGKTATIDDGFEAIPRRYVHGKGTDCERGELLLKEGDILGAKEIAVAASCGAAEVLVSSRPRVAIISTGDELVDIDQIPQPHQIRRSNSHSLAAALEASGLGCSKLYHFPDELDAVREGLATILSSSEVLILSGGVSKGKKDYLPGALADLGVQKVFHWVAQRPGKPFWFGLGSSGQPVFALPGNPLSALTCFHRYVLPALRSMAAQVLVSPVELVLGGDYTFRPPLTCFLPVRLENKGGPSEVLPDPAGNSGDFAGILGTDGFVELSAEPTEFSRGEIVPFWPWL